MSVKYIDSDGKEKELQTLVIDQLVDIVSGKNASANRTLAAEILQYVAQKRAENEAKPDFAMHACANHTLLNIHVSALWTMHEDKYGLGTTYHLQTVKGQDGVERMEMVTVRKTQVEPTPGPAPEFTPAVPLPVMQVSDVEKAAVNESSLTFDERYSPGAVAARVAAIEKEAAVTRRMREQTE